MRTVLILLSLTAAANAMTLEQVYIQQAAEIYVDHIYCKKPERYSDYMRLIGKAARERNGDYEKAIEMTQIVVLELLVQVGDSYCSARAK